VEGVVTRATKFIGLSLTLKMRAVLRQASVNQAWSLGFGWKRTSALYQSASSNRCSGAGTSTGIQLDLLVPG
jgi:hypothetical protein